LQNRLPLFSKERQKILLIWVTAKKKEHGLDSNTWKTSHRQSASFLHSQGMEKSIEIAEQTKLVVEVEGVESNKIKISPKAIVLKIGLQSVTIRL